MGGHGSGGHPSAGRKPEEAVATDGALPDVKPPKSLTDSQLAIWADLAPHALAKRTLVPATAERFARLCRNIELENRMAALIEEDGLTETKVSLQMDKEGGGVQTVEKKAHALLSRLFVINQRIDTGLTAFRLAPTGRPIAVDTQEKPQSALERLQARANIRSVK